MVQSRAADAAEVHAGALADGLEALQDGDVFGGIRGCHFERVLGVLGFYRFQGSGSWVPGF
jgi:hypothetical protein